MDLKVITVSPRFSIVITSHNQPGFIQDAIRSALSLRKGGAEIIVIDDASTDGSQAVLSAFGEAIHFIPLPTNRGKGGARNFGAAQATGDYLVFLDGDDAFLPWALDVYDRIVETKKPKLIISSMAWLKDVLPVTPPDAPREARIVTHADYLGKDRSIDISASSLIIDRQAFYDAGEWALDQPVMQDQDLVMRLGDAPGAVQIISPATTLHRAHAAQTISKVAPFLAVVYRMIRDENTGRYPGGRLRRLERRAFLGGLAFFWTLRALRAGMYWEGIKLAVRTSPEISIATARRLWLILKGRRPIETIQI